MYEFEIISKKIQQSNNAYKGDFENWKKNNLFYPYKKNKLSLEAFVTSDKVLYEDYESNICLFANCFMF